jgi:hypothetical protein
MSHVWLAVGAVGVGTILLKSVGPLLLGGRELPAPVASVVELLAPALLAALVVTQTVAGDRALVADARLLGVGVAAVAIRLRAPLLLVVILAAAVTAAARAL